MPKCFMCDKKGIFLKVNDEGICLSCQLLFQMIGKTRTNTERNTFKVEFTISELSVFDEVLRMIGNSYLGSDSYRLGVSIQHLLNYRSISRQEINGIIYSLNEMKIPIEIASEIAFSPNKRIDDALKILKSKL